MGATVIINGTEHGTTPLSVQLLGDQAAEGAVVEVELQMRGYAPFHVERVVTGEAIDITQTLQAVRRRSRGMRGGMGTEPQPALPSGGGGDYRHSPY